MEYTTTIEVHPSSWRDAIRILRRKTAVSDAGDIIYTFSGRFQDKTEVDVKVCNGDGPYLDIVLFDENGNEITVAEPTWSLAGVTIFEVDGNTYKVKLRKSNPVDLPC